jgi:hypothetical protein
MESRTAGPREIEMPLDPVLRETLEYLQCMLRGLRVTARSNNFGRIVRLIDMALLEAADIAKAQRPTSKPQPMPQGGPGRKKCGKGSLSATKHGSQVTLH